MRVVLRIFGRSIPIRRCGILPIEVDTIEPIDEEMDECFPDDKFAEEPNNDISEWMFLTHDFAAEDYFRDRSGVLEVAKRHGLGSSKALHWDEYPLEIQCNPCFCSWTEQTLANMVRNCEIRGEDGMITSFKNLTVLEPAPGDGQGTDWNLCPSTTTISVTNEDMIWEFAQKASLPMA
ncbi:hypothetical protein EsH8_V_001166 [Colletotrichum jinshuiense]